MRPLQEQPHFNVIENGIKEDIRVAFTHGRFRAMALLIYAGIDAMAFLDMPAGQIDVTGADFIRWAERWIRFPCQEQLTGEDLYGARCALLHTYTIESRMSRTGRARMIGYISSSVPEVKFQPHISTTLVIVSLEGLMNAFFNGVNAFLLSVYGDPAKSAIVDPRMEQFVHFFPFTYDPPANGDDVASSTPET